LPCHIYGNARRTSSGVNLAGEHEVNALAERMQAWGTASWSAGPLLSAPRRPQESEAPRAVTNPAHDGLPVGDVRFVTDGEVRTALTEAHAFQPEWDRVPADERAALLERAADLFEANLPELLALCTREAGKTLHDGVAEVREAADFLRYYALQARELFARPSVMPGPTGEHNEVSLHGRGVFACISPWNFPLAIFTGQVSAALAAGNTVLAKPAEPTPLIAHRAVQLLHEAGVPRAALQFLPGSGRRIGAILTADARGPWPNAMRPWRP
jgi:RHH-type proline utilization regulon transcriptional repressor/proline dehydrogenase/delta 1-pyrroline-5-carboxylate dehydrogenase